MKWLFGIVAVILITHLYFRWGRRRLERPPPEDETPGQD